MISSAQARVRPVSLADFQSVRDLILLSFVYGPDSPYRNARAYYLSRKVSYVLYALFCTGILLPMMLPPTMPSFVVFIGPLASFAIAIYFATLIYKLRQLFLAFCGEAFRTDLGNIAEHYQLSSDSTGDLSAKGPNGFWVAEVETAAGFQVVGCVGLDNSSVPGASELRRIAVSPFHRRRGIAATLMKQVRDHAKEHSISTLVLTTTEFQPDARRLYERDGWALDQFQNWVIGKGLIAVMKVIYRMELTKA
ncbi:acyl-CoA N-acyltransferase [Mycena floridula]|nr:acyl-CoA N-acyltransferase [Mycena floridula]